MLKSVTPCKVSLASWDKLSCLRASSIIFLDEATVMSRNDPMRETVCASLSNLTTCEVGRVAVSDSQVCEDGVESGRGVNRSWTMVLCTSPSSSSDRKEFSDLNGFLPTLLTVGIYPSHDIGQVLRSLLKEKRQG